jgi:hypothetical protein
VALIVGEPQKHLVAAKAAQNEQKKQSKSGKQEFALSYRWIRDLVEFCTE